MTKDVTRMSIEERERFFRGFSPEPSLSTNKTKRVGFKRLDEHATIPTKAHAMDSGFDVYASEDVLISPGETVVVHTGIAVQLPKGMEAQVRPRSGVTSRTELRVQLGTIDNGYIGEIGVIVDNIPKNGPSEILYGVDGKPIHDRDIALPDITNSYLIRKGDRIAQLVVQHLPQVEAVEVTELSEGERGSNGFGSTGVRNTEEFVGNWSPGGGLVDVEEVE